MQQMLAFARTAVWMLGIVGLAADAAVGQETPGSAPAREAAAPSYAVPRPPDGHPDLQGFWTNQTYTPLERPDGVDEPFYTPEEMDAILGGRTARETAQTTPGTIPDVHYDFTQFGLDRSQSRFARDLRTSLIVDPPDGRLPPVNAVGRRRAAEVAAARARMGGRWDAAENNQLDDRCVIMRGAGPPMLNAGYNANYQIVQSRDHVMILVEMIHDARIIPLDGRGQAPDRARGWMGLPRGRWDGDTLVVETTNFNGRNPFSGSSDRMRVTERFTRTGEDSILYEFTVYDPATWDRAWTAQMPMTRTVGPLFEHACHEGNYGLYNSLVGARREERLAAEAALAAEEAAAPAPR